MRRLLRYILNGLTVLSLLLCVAACVLWVRSYRADEILTWRRARRVPLDGGTEPGVAFFWRTLRSKRGVIAIEWESSLHRAPGSPWTVQQLKSNPEGTEWHHHRRRLREVYVPGPGIGFCGARPPDVVPPHGFYFQRNSRNRNLPVGVEEAGTYLAVPLWSLAAATGTLPGAWLGAAVVATLRKRSRARSGLCPRCGYDLRGNLSGTCPECGAPALKGGQA